MDTPITRREFEYRMNLLEEKIRNGKFHISSHCLAMYDGLTKVRRMDNGRIDLLTVDESARLTANMMADFNKLDMGKFEHSTNGEEEK